MSYRNGFLAAVAAAAVFGASAAGAATVLESFNDFPNGPSDSYTSQGFTYTPTKTTNGQCFESLCLQEYSQPDGVITTITRAEEPEEFDFLGFYLNFNGLTETDAYNFLTITDDEDPSVEIGFNLVDDFDTIFSGITGYQVWLVDITGPTTTISSLLGTDGFSKEANGFFIALGDAFLDVTSIRFFSEGQGTLRIDCAYYNVGDGGSFSSEELTGCTPSEPPVIPVPAAGWLLLAGLGGFAAMRRFKAA